MANMNNRTMQSKHATLPIVKKRPQINSNRVEDIYAEIKGDLSLCFKTISMFCVPGIINRDQNKTILCKKCSQLKDKEQILRPYFQQSNGKRQAHP